MNSPNINSGWSIFRRMLLTAALIDMGLMVLTGLVCWLAGWRSLYQYSTGLILAGALAFILGVFSLQGNWGVARNPIYQVSQSASGQSISERTQRVMLDTYQSFAFVIQMALAGGIAIAIGILLQSLL